MATNLVTDYNILKSNIISAVADYSVNMYNKHSNSIIKFIDTLRYLLLIRYCRFIFSYEVYDDYVDHGDYIVGNFVVLNDIFYICIQDTGGYLLNPLYNPEYWAVHIPFTYDYDLILSAVDKINRICGTKFTI